MNLVLPIRVQPNLENFIIVPNSVETGLRDLEYL